HRRKFEPGTLRGERNDVSSPTRITGRCVRKLIQSDAATLQFESGCYVEAPRGDRDVANPLRRQSLKEFDGSGDCDEVSWKLWLLFFQKSAELRFDLVFLFFRCGIAGEQVADDGRAGRLVVCAPIERV